MGVGRRLLFFVLLFLGGYYFYISLPHFDAFFLLLECSCSRFRVEGRIIKICNEEWVPFLRLITFPNSVFLFDTLRFLRFCGAVSFPEEYNSMARRKSFWSFNDLLGLSILSVCKVKQAFMNQNSMHTEIGFKQSK